MDSDSESAFGPIGPYAHYGEMVTAASSPDKPTREEFWSTVATTLLHWESSNFTNIIGDIGDPNSNWFDGGELNVCYNAVDRHALSDPDRIALLYEGNTPGTGYQVTYGELLTRVCKLANILLQFGVSKGSVVVIYLPVSVQAIVSMLACARIGAIHSLVFGAFRGDALRFRISDCQPSVVITANSYPRASKMIPMKICLDDVLGSCPSVTTVIVCRLTDDIVSMSSDRDFFLDDLMEKVSPICECTPVSARDPLFYLYTSGSTGDPKGIVHRAGGYAVAACLSHRYVFSLRPGDIFGCTSGLGWITGHSYVCYGPLLNGVTTLVFGGLPLYPSASRPWELIEKYRLTHFYTAPSVARAIADRVSEIDISSLRVIGSVGETLDENAYRVLHEVMGRGNYDIVDT
jgi:acetyl-CoA synthetase